MTENLLRLEREVLVERKIVVHSLLSEIHKARYILEFRIFQI